MHDRLLAYVILQAVRSAKRQVDKQPGLYIALRDDSGVSVTLGYLAVRLEVSLDIFNGRRRRQAAHEHLLSPRHHLTCLHKIKALICINLGADKSRDLN